MHFKGTNEGVWWPNLEGPAGTCLLVDNEIIFGVDVPPSEKVNLIELSPLFTTKGIWAKYAEKGMNSRTFFL